MVLVALAGVYVLVKYVLPASTTPATTAAASKASPSGGASSGGGSGGGSGAKAAAPAASAQSAASAPLSFLDKVVNIFQENPGISLGEASAGALGGGYAGSETGAVSSLFGGPNQAPLVASSVPIEFIPPPAPDPSSTDSSLIDYASSGLDFSGGLYE